jgi:Fe2+ or Zn2+ uptake regulation protein
MTSEGMTYEEALGLKPKAETVTEKKSEKPEKLGEEQLKQHSVAELKITARRRRVFELRCRGFTIPQIAEKLKEEGQLWSEDTIYSDLHSDQAREFLEELQRQQLADITLTKSRKLKLVFRDRMIERFTPRKSPDVAIVNVNQQTTVKQQDNLLEEYANAISQATEVNQSIPAICTGESVDSKETSPSDGEKRPDSKANAIPMPS